MMLKIAFVPANSLVFQIIEAFRFLEKRSREGSKSHFSKKNAQNPTILWCPEFRNSRNLEP